MGEVAAEIEVPAPIADAWDLYFDRDRWPGWVDQYGRLLSADGYPEVGGVLAWESNAAGRGRVAERVLAHERRRLHLVSFEDPTTTGTLEVRFEMVPASGAERSTSVGQKLTYELRGGGIFGKLTDRLFIRSQMRQSLQRSLVDFRAELIDRGEPDRGDGGCDDAAAAAAGDGQG